MRKSTLAASLILAAALLLFGAKKLPDLAKARNGWTASCSRGDRDPGGAGAGTGFGTGAERRLERRRAGRA